uniref:CCHC-type domain-containing protein n=1 Tax=Manihot esculenta TaxID=3983 RepID=A0A2C9U3E0_MANES
MDACTIIFHFKELFSSQSMIERYETSKELFSYKMMEGSSIHAYGLKMIRYIEKLAQLNFIMDHYYAQFIMNFNMHNLDDELSELVNMLVTAEKCLKKEKVSILMVQSSKAKKKKSKKKQIKKKAYTTLKPTGGVKKYKVTCHHCGKEGHLRRNCKEYLAIVKAKKFGEASTSV